MLCKQCVWRIYTRSINSHTLSCLPLIGMMWKLRRPRKNSRGATRHHHHCERGQRREKCHLHLQFNTRGHNSVEWATAPNGRLLLFETVFKIDAPHVCVLFVPRRTSCGSRKISVLGKQNSDFPLCLPSVLLMLHCGGLRVKVSLKLLFACGWQGVVDPKER